MCNHRISGRLNIFERVVVLGRKRERTREREREREREGENKFKHNVPLSQQGVNTFTKG